MASFYTPAQRRDDEEGLGDLSEIKQRLFAATETPFTGRNSLLGNVKQPVLVFLRIRPKNAVEVANNDPTCLHINSDYVLLATPPKSSHAFKTKGERNGRNFIFSRIFPPDASQKTVFDAAVLPTLSDFLDGQNCLVFSYGVTNSGKSYTVTGKSCEPGVLPRALDVIFNSVGEYQFTSCDLKPKHYADARYLTEAERATEREIRESLFNKANQLQQAHMSAHTQSVVVSEGGEDGCSTAAEETIQLEDTSTLSKTSNISRMTEEGGSLSLDEMLVHEDTTLDVDTHNGSLSFSIWVSFAEIYNEFIYDLLGEEPKAGRQRTALKLSEDRNRNPFIKGLREVRVESSEEALQLLRVGLQHRHVAATRLNYHSSRSHAIFTIKILRVVSSGRRPKVARVNRISIVDLAGSERTRRTGATGMRVKEAGNINNSLLTLGRCIEAMRHNQASRKGDERVVPFRESKLTQLLQTYFVGKGKGAREGRVAMFVNVSDTGSVYDETLRVLDFSALASKVVPETKLPSSTRLPPLPESSPFRPDPEDTPTSTTRITTKQWDEDDSEGVEAGAKDYAGSSYTATVASCSRCKVIVEELERFKERAREELAKAKVEIWEKEYLIRQQVSSEYNEQLVEIEERHTRELHEQELELEEMYQDRLDLMHKSMKKQRTRKRMRALDVEDDSPHEEEQSRVKELEREKRKLLKQVDDLTEELEQEQKRAASELQDMSVSHETKITKLREVTNSLSLQVSSMEKELVQAGEEKEALQHRVETLVAEQSRSKQELEELMKEAESFKAECKKHRETTEQEKGAQLEDFEKEREELLMQIIELEAAVRSPRPLHLCETASQTDPCVTGGGLPGTIAEEQQALQEGSQPVAEEKQLNVEAGQLEVETLRKLVFSLKDEVSAHVDTQQLLKKQHKQELEKVQEDSQTAVSRHQALVSQLEEQLAQRSEEARQNQQKVLQLTEKLDALTENATANDDLVQELRETLRQYEETFQSQSSRIDALSSENESLKESCETLQDRVECDSVDMAALKLRVERLTDSKNTQAARLEELGDEISRSRKQLLQREAELTDFHESAREVLEGQLADLKKRCAMLEQEVKETQHKLEDKEEAIVELTKSSSSEQVAAAGRISALSEELQQVRATLREVEEERDRVRETVAAGEQQLKSQLDSLQGNHQLEIAQISIKARALSEQLDSKQAELEALAEAHSLELEKIRGEHEAELMEKKKKVADLEYRVAQLLSSSSPESDPVFVVPSQAPAAELIDDAVLLSDGHVVVQQENPLSEHNTTTSSHNSQDTTRRLPLLERSSQLVDSFEDFESPKRVIVYDPLKDARRKKQPAKRRERAKKTASVASASGTTSSSGNDEQPREIQVGYALRSRKKINYTCDEESQDSDGNVENRTPMQKIRKYFREKTEGKKAGTTSRKRRIRKSQISSPLDTYVTEVPQRRTVTKIPLGSSLKPSSRRY